MSTIFLQGDTNLVTDVNGTVLGTSGDDVIWGTDGHDSIDGGQGFDAIAGLAGDDTLNGGKDGIIDHMAGGVGNDTYIIDEYEVIDEAFKNEFWYGDGVDTVRSGITYSLDTADSAHNGGLLLGDIENLVLTGTADIDGYGNALDNEITGNDGNNHLFGALGNDTLDGGKGNDVLDGGADGQTDVLIGGDGNDTYIIGDTADMVVEANSTGIDLVQSSVSYSLAAIGKVIGDVENLTLTGTGDISGTGNRLDNHITGNSGNNHLSGGDGNDVLDGGTGMDAMAGGRGADRYFVDNIGDTVIEDYEYVGGQLSPITGRGDWLAHFQDVSRTVLDVVVSTVDFTLGKNVEQLQLTGSAAINGTGNELDNAITGNGKNNILKGLDGSDSIWGGGGKDTLFGGNGDDWLDGGYDHDVLTGGAGRDSFVFGANFGIDKTINRANQAYINASSDTVTDFTKGEDLIMLSMKAFGVTGIGAVGDTLSAAHFVNGAYAKDKDDYFLYDKETGRLWFDFNGSDQIPYDAKTTWTGRRLIATFTDADGHHPLKIDASDFMLIA